MSIRDSKMIVTVQNGLTNEIEQVDYSLPGLGFFNVQIKDYLLLQKIKRCIDSGMPCYINFGFKK